MKNRSVPPSFVVNKPQISASMEAALQKHYETGSSFQMDAHDHFVLFCLLSLLFCLCCVSSLLTATRAAPSTSTATDGFTADELLKENPGLTYDDFLLLPGHIYFSPADVSTTTRVSKNIRVKCPFVSSPMDTVSEASLAIAMALQVIVCVSVCVCVCVCVHLCCSLSPFSTKNGLLLLTPIVPEDKS